MREKQFLSLILCDVDFFKNYNDKYGHPAGDDCLRPGDLVARYGGEEFVVILPNTNFEGAMQIAQEIRQGVDTLHLPHALSTVSNHVTLSLGGASIIPNPNYSPTDLINSADQALYSAKKQGRNRVIFQDLSHSHPSNST